MRYSLPYLTRLGPDLEVLVHLNWSPWLPLLGGRKHYSTFLSELEAKLPTFQPAIIKKFLGAASQSGRRPCTVFLARRDTSLYFEVFSEHLFFWETWPGRMSASIRAYPCGSYAVKDGRAMWVAFL
jgi:hypothetical protein